MTDHRARAERILAIGSELDPTVPLPQPTGLELQAMQVALLRAQVHATLAAIPAPRKLSLEEMDAQLSEHVQSQFAALRELREAVRIWLDADAGRALIGDPFAQDVAELIDYRAPEA